MINSDNLEKFRQEIINIPPIFDNATDTWWKAIARLMLSYRNKLDEFPDPTTIEFYREHIDNILNALRDAQQLSQMTEEQICAFTDSILMNNSANMAIGLETRESDINAHFISIDDLIHKYHERFALSEIELEGIKFRKLDIKRRSGQGMDSVILPPVDPSFYIGQKGGVARYIVDIIAGSPNSMQDSEVPFNDFDVMVYGDIIKGKKIAILMGADDAGVEYGGNEPELNFYKYARGRDTTQNEALLDSEGIHFTDEAVASARTGMIHLTSTYMANRAIYGVDYTFIDHVRVATPRGMMRCVKAVCEGKASAFDYVPLSRQFDFGIYTLFLAKKWSRKNSFPERLDKMYHLLSEMGQIRDDEKDMFDVMRRVHIDHPFFELIKQPLDPIHLIRWKLKKLVRQLDREFRWRNHIHSLSQVKRDPGDFNSRILSLNDYKQNLSFINNFSDQAWSNFVAECESRREEYNATGELDDLYNYFFGELNNKGRYDDIPLEEN